MSITEIIRQGLAHGDSYELINQRLAEAGCEFRLSTTEKTGWTEQEIKEGFLEGEEAKPVIHLADLMKRHEAYAGGSYKFWCAEGEYEVTYNKDGYATKAVRQ